MPARLHDKDREGKQNQQVEVGTYIEKRSKTSGEDSRFVVRVYRLIDPKIWIISEIMIRIGVLEEKKKKGGTYTTEY